MPNQSRTREDVYIDAMVEMVEAINAYFSEETLLRLYQLTLIGHLGLSRFTLLVEENGHWVAKATHGTGLHIPDDAIAPLISKLKSHGELEALPENHPLHGFTYVIPTIRKSRAQSLDLLADEKIIALLLLGGESIHPQQDSNLLKFLNAVTHMMNLAIYNRRLEASEKEQQRMNIELSFAEQVQMGLYPKNLPTDGNLKVAASMIGFGKVSGDYYDYIPLGRERYIICLGDVSGKGMGAALLMANFQAGLRSLVNHTSDLKALVKELNSVILHNGRGDRFVTAFLALVDMKVRTLTYINAAHPPALLMLPGGEIKELSTGTTLIGIFPYLHTIEVGTENLPEGFTMLMYTDGVSETFNLEREEFGDERIEAILRNHRPEESLDNLHANILQALEDFRAGAEAADDVTLFSMQG